MKSISIMRLKPFDIVAIVHLFSVLKWKASQLWDWNIKRSCARFSGFTYWNEKHLNYEIETSEKSGVIDFIAFILKWKASQLWDWNSCPSNRCCMSCINWNEKHLNYEIETCHERKVQGQKHRWLKWKASQLWDWNSYRVPSGSHPLELKWKASQLWDWNR